MGFCENGSRRFTSHKLRKLFTSILYKEGMDKLMIDWCLGHKVNPVTEAYFKANIEHLKREYRKRMHALTLEKSRVRRVMSDEVREMRRVLGEFKTATQLYTLVSRRCKYKFYYNDQTPNREALKKMVTDGINCTDACQLFKPVIEGLGYSVRIEHVKVKCNDNKWYGHYFLRVAGKELASVSLPSERWTVWDYVSATKTGRPLGAPCCSRGIQHLGWGIVGPVYDK